VARGVDDQRRMLASVIVNNHNYGRYLRFAIDSALAQTHPDVEVIVVDDGSTDDSREVMATYGERIIPIYKRNGGQASAINVGVAAARGEALFFLDADDILKPDIVARVVNAFESDPGLVWAMFRLEVTDAAGKPTGVLRPQAHIPRRDGDLRRSIVEFPFDIVRTATSGNAFKARVVKRILPIPEAVYFSGADAYLSPLAGLFGRCVFLDCIGGGYRVHGSNDNWFEGRSMTLDLSGIRKEIRWMEVSASAIEKFAREEGISEGRRVLSLTFIAARLVSLKLCPAGHPMVDDTALDLAVLGIRAAVRRFDVRWPLKVLFIAWFVAMSVAPPALALGLAQIWYFPGRRGHLNSALSVLHVPARAWARSAARMSRPVS
jgi:glycosyltransferase involved in cell wall biosynthesis